MIHLSFPVAFTTERNRDRSQRLDRSGELPRRTVHAAGQGQARTRRVGHHRDVGEVWKYVEVSVDLGL